jgi:TrmH family RNA methyltransferase
MMLSKTQSKYIRSLALQKFRKEHQSFIAEGEKIVGEWLISNQKISIIVGIEEWMQANKAIIKQHPEAQLITVSEAELKQISTLQSPNKVLIVVPNIESRIIEPIDEWCIALDGIRDPGNMGTILRIADWFGVQHVLCSNDCVDVYSPKVVQAAMGAHLRIRIHETDLIAFVQQSPLTAYAATLGGSNVYTLPKYDKGILIIGNEAQGVCAELQTLAQIQITIPRKGGAESLNAGVSAGILCALLMGG